MTIKSQLLLSLAVVFAVSIAVSIISYNDTRIVEVHRNHAVF